MPYHCNCNCAQLCSHWSCLYASMLYKFQISRIIIHQISLFVHDWSKFMTWPYTSQLKLGNIWDYSLIFKTAHVAKTIWRIINTIGSILLLLLLLLFGKKICWVRYLSLDIICSSKLTVFLLRNTVRFLEQIMSKDKYPSLFSCQMEATINLATASRSICLILFLASLFTLGIL